VEIVAPKVDRTLDGARLRGILEAYPDRFRLLDPWRGPWRTLARDVGAHAVDIDVWVVATSEPGGAPEGARTVLKLRESVRWLGRGIDPRSPGEVSRWYALVLSERAVRAAVAADGGVWVCRAARASHWGQFVFLDRRLAVLGSGRYWLGE